MFDTNNTITLGGMYLATGKADVTVRWPTDEECVAHRKRSHLYLISLGRGLQEYEQDTTAADTALYEAIKVNGAPPLTASEAGFVIGKILQCRVMGVDLGSGEATVEMLIPTGRVQHTVRIPTMDEARTLTKSTRHITLRHNRMEIKASLEAAARLWDQCAGKAEGYAGPVPNIHKDAAIRAVLEEIEQGTAGKDDEANF